MILTWFIFVSDWHADVVDYLGYRDRVYVLHYSGRCAAKTFIKLIINLPSYIIHWQIRGIFDMPGLICCCLCICKNDDMPFACHCQVGLHFLLQCHLVPESIVILNKMLSNSSQVSFYVLYSVWRRWKLWCQFVFTCFGGHESCVFSIFFIILGGQHANCYVNMFFFVLGRHESSDLGWCGPDDYHYVGLCHFGDCRCYQNWRHGYCFSPGRRRRTCYFQYVICYANQSGE